jgi:hypothetical protein
VVGWGAEAEGEGSAGGRYTKGDLITLINIMLRLF